MVKLILGLLLFLATLIATPSLSASGHPGTPLTHGSYGDEDNYPKAQQITTEPVTTPAGQLTLVWVGTSDGRRGPPTVSDPNRTWTMVANGSPGLRRLTLFATTDGATGPVTFVNPPSYPTTWAWTMLAFPATQVVQVKYDHYRTGVLTSGTVTLPNGGSGGYTVATFAVHYTAVLSPGPGYEFVGGQPVTRLRVQAESRPDFAQAATMTWDSDAHWMGIAAELR